MQLYKYNNKREENQATSRLPNAIFEPRDMQKDRHHHHHHRHYHHHHLVLNAGQGLQSLNSKTCKSAVEQPVKSLNCKKGRPSNWSQNSLTYLASFLFSSRIDFLSQSSL